MSDESLKEEILINVTSSEIRAALLENGVLQEVHIERSARRGLISNIYKGRALRVLPGMQAAFVDIGLERTAFLHASDIAAGERHDRSDETPNIRELVREGDRLVTLDDRLAQARLRLAELSASRTSALQQAAIQLKFEGKMSPPLRKISQTRLDHDHCSSTTTRQA